MTLRVLSICASLSSSAGGVFEVQKAIAKHCSELDIETVAVGVEDSNWTQDRHEWGTVDAHVFPSESLRFFRYSSKLSAFVLRHEKDFDVVHLHGLWLYPSLLTRQLQRRFQKPTVVTPHGMLDKWALANSVWKKRLAMFFYEHAMLRSATCFHAQSQRELMDIRELGFNNPVAIIPNGVDLQNTSDDVVRTRNVLFLGRLHPKKGLVQLIQGWKQLPKSITDSWKLRIVGWDDGGHERELRSLVEEVGLKNSVLFEGPKFGRDKGLALAEASVFILPSFSEGLPIAVLEAWQAGLPVVMTKFCNLDVGFTCNSAIEINPDATSIRDGLIRILSMSDKQRLDMGLNGQRLVEEQFSWDGVAQKLASVYQWVLNRSDQPDCVFRNA